MLWEVKQLKGEKAHHARRCRRLVGLDFWPDKNYFFLTKLSSTLVGQLDDNEP